MANILTSSNMHTKLTTSSLDQLDLVEVSLSEISYLLDSKVRRNYRSKKLGTVSNILTILVSLYLLSASPSRGTQYLDLINSRIECDDVSYPVSEVLVSRR